MIQPKTESSSTRSHVEPNRAETVAQNARLRDPRLARQMQFQNSTQRSFNQRNRSAPLAAGIQRFGHPAASFASNNQLDNPVTNRPPATFNATIMDDSGRQSRTAGKTRGSSKDVKNRLTSKTSPKSQKSNSQKSPKSPAKSSSKNSKTSNSNTSPTSNRSSSKDHKKDRSKESNKLSPSRGSSAIVALAEAEKKIKEFTIPFKKRSPSPKDKSPKSITDPKVSSTTKTPDSPIKFKGSKTNSKARNYVKRNRDECKSPIPNKDNAEIVQQKTPPSASSTSSSSTTTTKTSELVGSPVPPPTEPIPGGPANISSAPFAGDGDNQSFKSKDTTFVVRMVKVKVSHIVHSLLTRLMISIGLIIDCVNHRDNFLNKLIVIGTGDNFFIETFCRFFFVQIQFFRFLTILYQKNFLDFFFILKVHSNFLKTLARSVGEFATE